MRLANFRPPPLPLDRRHRDVCPQTHMNHEGRPDIRAMTNRLLRIMAWAILLAIIVATLSPIDFRPRSSFPVSVERAGAFGLAGLLFALAYPRRIWWAAVVLLVGVAGLEILQQIRIDRHGRVDDALIKAIGAFLGLGAGWLLTRFAGRLRS